MKIGRHRSPDPIGYDAPAAMKLATQLSLILVGALLIFAQGSVLAPFIYTIF